MLDITSLKPDSMRLQDRFKYDPTLLRLEGIYEPLGIDSFLIDSICIMVADQIISTGDTYFLVERDDKQPLTFHAPWVPLLPRRTVPIHRLPKKRFSI